MNHSFWLQESLKLSFRPDGSTLVNAGQSESVLGSHAGQHVGFTYSRLTQQGGITFPHCLLLSLELITKISLSWSMINCIKPASPKVMSSSCSELHLPSASGSARWRKVVLKHANTPFRETAFPNLSEKKKGFITP